MGIDGTNRLHIRGPKEVLDVLQNCGLAVPFPDDKPWLYLVQNYFGPANVKMHRTSERYLYMSYAFRNQPCYDYLLHILQKYPQVWMKNEYDTEEGFCGVWVAHMQRYMPSILMVDWTVPKIEEMMYCEDFSYGLNGDSPVDAHLEDADADADADIEEAPVAKPIKKRVIPVSK
jgi:hypothetical protein